MPDVAAYLVHWNAPQWCAESVQSLLEQRGVDVKTTVINNGGKLVLPAHVAVVDSGGNLGYTGGANLGLRLGLAEGAPYILIGCHDVRLTDTSLQAMVTLLQKDAGLGVVGPVLDGAGDTEQDLEWISGTALLVRRDVARELDFDERWGSYIEDVDFCYRARDLGWRIGRAGKAHAQTRGSVDSAAALHLMHSNTLVFFLRRRMWRRAAGRAVLILRERRLRTLLRGMVLFVTFPVRRGRARQG